MEDTILYVIINKSLKMSAGKAAAQTAHAVALLGDKVKDFTTATRRTVIVLEADSAEQIRNLSIYLEEAGIFSDYYIDEGSNEVPPYSITALAVEPFYANDEAKRQIFADLELFTGLGNKYEDAIDSLERVTRGFRGYDMTSTYDSTPRYFRKTLDYLRERRG